MSLEARLRALHEAGDLQALSTAALEGYGPELLGWLVAVARDEDLGREAFADFSEDLWRGLPGFRWASSFRTWAYVLARHALARLLRDPRRRRARNLSLSHVAEVAARVATTTLAHLRTGAKDRVARLREGLSPEEQSLLILRVDRQMTWPEIAEVLGDAEPGAREREAARLRKQFQRVVRRLRELTAT